MTVKHRQLAPTVGPLANDHQKNSMVFLNDNSMPLEGISSCVGSWIFVADGSGGFKSRPIDQTAKEVPEATNHGEPNDFVDQLEEVGIPALDNETQIQSEFDVIKTKTLSELEEDLERLLKDTKQETSMSGKILLSNCTRFTEPSL